MNSHDSSVHLNINSFIVDITDKDGRDGVSISGEHRMIQTTRRESKESKLRIQYSDNATIKF